MRKLIVLAAIVVGGYYALQYFKGSRPAPKGDGTMTSGAKAQQRIDNLSGAAPAEH